MDIKLEQEIYQIDPVFFRQKDMDMTQTCMCWGIECGDGWFEPIRKFVHKVKVLNGIIAPIGMCIVASQIKSKWASFTCYWNIDTLAEGADIELTNEQEDLIETVQGLMDDAVSGCEEECSHTCEICGKNSIWDDEVFVCGSWLTVKCVECAQRQQREAGRITNFRDGFQFLSPFVKESIEIDGVHYPTIIGAYYATLDKECATMFREMTSPAEVQAVAMETGVCRDDEHAFQTMKRILEIRYSNEKRKSQLLGTKGLEIVQSNHSHENSWGSCWCRECEGKGMNRYGKMLMEIRDELLKEHENDKDD